MSHLKFMVSIEETFSRRRPPKRCCRHSSVSHLVGWKTFPTGNPSTFPRFLLEAWKLQKARRITSNQFIEVSRSIKSKQFELTASVDFPFKLGEFSTQKSFLLGQQLEMIVVFLSREKFNRLLYIIAHPSRMIQLNFYDNNSDSIQSMLDFPNRKKSLCLFCNEYFSLPLNVSF